MRERYEGKPEHEADFRLAHAAANGDAQAQQAVAALARDAFAHLRRSLGNLEDETQQRVLMHLFGVGKDDARLSAYAGTGALAGWLRIVVTRLALNTRRDLSAAQKGWISSDDQLAEATTNPELMLLKMQNHAGFKGAFANAVSKLTDRERLLIKLRFVDGLQQDQIAQLMQSHRVTVANWLKDVQQKLQGALQSELNSVLGPGDLRSLGDWMVSNPDLSMSRLFARAEK